MRKVANLSPDVCEQSGFERLMIVTNPQPGWVDPGCGVLFAYFGSDGRDKPAYMRWPFDDFEYAVEYTRETWGVQVAAWREVPDQMPGCLDDWIAPVRLSRIRDGKQWVNRWERFVDGGWIQFEGQASRRAILSLGVTLRRWKRTMKENSSRVPGKSAPGWRQERRPACQVARE